MRVARLCVFPMPLNPKARAIPLERAAEGGTVFGFAGLGGKVLRQASAEHFEQCAEFLPLRNRGLGPLAVTVLPVPFARRAAATACAAVQSAAALLVARLSPRTAVPMV